jgi:hypothetical protein
MLGPDHLGWCCILYWDDNTHERPIKNVVPKHAVNNFSHFLKHPLVGARFACDTLYNRAFATRVVSTPS